MFWIVQFFSFNICVKQYAQSGIEKIVQNEFEGEMLNKMEELVVKSDLEKAVQIETEKTKLEINEEFKITINTKNISVAACTIRLYFDTEKVELISNPENSHKVNDMILYTWYDKQGGEEKTEDRKLAEFTFRARQNGTCIFAMEGEFYNEKEQKVETAIIPLEIKIGEEQVLSEMDEQILEETSSDNKKNSNLAILRLEQEGISPDFRKEIKDYYITVLEDVESLAITAIPENENSKVTIVGNKNLKNGLNTISIKVEAEDKQSQTEYKIYVTKTSDLNSANANLENLAIENTVLEPTFWEGVTNYKITVDNDVQSLNVLAVPQNEKASVKVTGENDLKEGNNKVTVAVTAKNDTTFKKYEIEVYKKSKLETEQAKQERQENLQMPEVTIDNSKEIEETQIEQREIQAKNGLWLIWCVIIIIAVGGIIGIVIVKRKNNKKDK